MTATQKAMKKDLEEKLGYSLREVADLLLRELITESSDDVPQKKAVDPEKELMIKVTELCRDVGIPASLKGYCYIRTAIIKVYEDHRLINQVTSVLYPEVAKMYDTTAPRVERAIRHAIEVAWRIGDIEVLQRYFGNTISNLKCKPTNSEFIAMMAEQLHLQEEK